MENQITLKEYKPFSYNFIRAYIITMRPYLMFVSGITGLAGISFSSSESELRLILIFIASFLSYGFGQALTDCFQIDTDSISSPYRPLTQHIVSIKSFLIISVLGLTFCVTVFGIYNPLNFILGFIAGAGLATYTFFKRRWWGGPFYNAWIVSDLFIISYLAGINEHSFSAAVIFTILSVFFGYANFVLSGYFKDISADRATGYNTLLVKFGKKISAITSDIFALLFVLFSLLTILSLKNSYSANDLPLILFFLAGLSYSIYAQFKLHKVKTDEGAFTAIAPVVHAYILLLSSITLASHPEWWIPIVIFYSGYLIVLKIRPAKEQV
ncbi:MAG TPA: UbiA family prenyltransferase [Ignavibacteriaceae bacterium]|nr:UbiA family prenyltransferase [Ignavibacteriaceae bacterium]